MKLTTNKTHILELDHEEFLVIKNVLVKAANSLTINDYEQVTIHDFIKTANERGL